MTGSVVMREWSSTTVGALGKLHCGQSPSSAFVNTNGEGTVYVSGPEHWDGSVVHRSKWTTAPARLAPGRSIFITVKGSGVGTLFPGIDAAIGRDIYAFEPHPEIDFRFVYRALQYSIQDVIARARGDIPGLSKAHILDHAISVPGRRTQAAVASKIDELFSEIDEGERALERVGRLVERYRQSVLKAAVTGELTSGASSQGLPSGWQLRSLADLSDEKPANGISVKGSDSPPGVAALRLDAITEAGFDFGARRFIPISEEKANRLAIQAGDFFVSRANGSLQLVGRGVLASQPPSQTVFPDTMIRYRLGRSEALNRWVAMVWGSGWVRRQVEVKAKTTAGIYKISQTDIAEITFPVPSTEAEMLDAVDAVAKQSGAWRGLVRETAERQRQSSALRQSILKAAFSGQLVPQDPRDEPASALLARLAAQAAHAPATPRRRAARRTADA